MTTSIQFAYAVVQNKNIATWQWFLTYLSEDISIGDRRGRMFMTDRQKGLQNVVDEFFPEVEYRFCVRHMYTNFFNAQFKSQILKNYLRRATNRPLLLTTNIGCIKFVNLVMRYTNGLWIDVYENGVDHISWFNRRMRFGLTIYARCSPRLYEVIDKKLVVNVNFSIINLHEQDSKASRQDGEVYRMLVSKDHEKIAQDC